MANHLPLKNNTLSLSQPAIDSFYSRGQQLRLFLGTKKVFILEKSSIPTRIGSVQQYGRRDVI